MEIEQLENLYTLFQKYPNVITDSRKIEKDCLFFALKGDRFNGNEYAEEAIKKGAAYAIIDEDRFDKGEQYFLVKDVLTALQQLANFHRRRMLIPIIGITGSNGKTTTKELIAAVLNNYYQCHFTQGNFNNHIGVPLTLLKMTSEAQVAIIEMGANHVGEIELLCDIAEPTHGLITNIGKAHLEGFGSLEGVKKGKSELYKFIGKHDGVAFVNMDELYLTDLSEGILKRVFYKKSKEPNINRAPYESILIKSDSFLKVGFLGINQELIEVNSNLMGHYNFQNIMTAITVGRYFRVPQQKIKEAIENYVPSNNRSQIVEKNSNTFLLDAYNANPTSMKNALENFGKIKADKKIAILGDMLELGDYSLNEHQAIITFTQTLGLDKVLLVGKEFSKAKTETAEYFDDVQNLKEWFEKQGFQNTHFLIKGSRGIRLEKLLSD